MAIILSRKNAKLRVELRKAMASNSTGMKTFRFFPFKSKLNNLEFIDFFYKEKFITGNRTII